MLTFRGLRQSGQPVGSNRSVIIVNWNDGNVWLFRELALFKEPCEGHATDDPLKVRLITISFTDHALLVFKVGLATPLSSFREHRYPEKLLVDIGSSQHGDYTAEESINM